MNHRWIFVWLAVFLVACSSPSTSGKDSSSTSDAGQDAVSGDTVSGDAGADGTATPTDAADDSSTTDDTGPNCECTGPSTCCDGCHPQNVGDDCDDGLTCTLGTTCQPDGTCAGATGSPCDELVDFPSCQQASCDEVAGCDVQDVHEGFECDDDDPQTYDDRCHLGECAGTDCECSGQNTCCDGCLAQNEGQSCDDGDDLTRNETCQSGQCVGEQCDCLDGPCCDGCHFNSTDTQCDEYGDREECQSSCGGTGVLMDTLRFCSGQSSDCDGREQDNVISVVATCTPPDGCSVVQGNAVCSYEPGCD